MCSQTLPARSFPLNWRFCLLHHCLCRYSSFLTPCLDEPGSGASYYNESKFFFACLAFDWLHGFAVLTFVQWLVLTAQSAMRLRCNRTNSTIGTIYAVKSWWRFSKNWPNWWMVGIFWGLERLSSNNSKVFVSNFLIMMQKRIGLHSPVWQSRVFKPCRHFSLNRRVLSYPW